MRFARAARPLFALVGLLVLVTSFLAAGVPRLLEQQYDRSVRKWARNAGTDVTDMAVLGQMGGRHPAGVLDRTTSLDDLTNRLRDALPPHLNDVAGPISYRAATSLLFLPPIAGGNTQGATYVSYDPGIDSRVRYVAGRAPRNPMPSPDATPFTPGPPIEVGLAAKAAAALSVKPGDLIRLQGTATDPFVPQIRVTGTYEPISQADPYWRYHTFFLNAQEVRLGRDSFVSATSTVLDPAGYAALYRTTVVHLSYTWMIPVDVGRLTAAGAVPVAADVARAQVQVSSTAAPGTTFELDTGLAGSLSGFADQLRATRVVLSLALGGLDAVALGVLLLLCGVLLERLRTVLSGTRARGAAWWQLALGVVRAMAVVAVPAAVLGALIGVLAFSGPVSRLSIAGPIAVVVLATVVPGLLAAWIHRRPLRVERGDLAVGRFSPRRIVIELLAVVLAVAAVTTLRVRGLGGTDGTNPLLSALPVLMAVALGVVVLRVYPYPLKMLGRLARRGRTVVSYLGVTQAARQRLGIALPALVLLLATAIAAFSATVDSAIREAQAAGAWHAIGADAQLTSAYIGPDGLEQIKKVRGVTGALPIRVLPSVGLSGAPGPVIAVGVDLNDYRALVRGLPIDLPSVPAVRPGQPLPALVSPSLAHGVGTDPTMTVPDGSSVALHTVGTIDRFPTVDPGAQLVVVPRAAFAGSGQYASSVLVRGSHLEATALTAAAVPSTLRSEVTAETHEHRLKEITATPLVGVLRDGFGYGAFVMGGYGALAVLMALVLGAQARGRTVWHMRTMGFSGRQMSTLALLELGPLVLTAIVTGAALGLAMPAVLGSKLDLRPYTGGFPVAIRLIDSGTAMLLAGGLAVIIGAAVAVDATVNARKRLTTVPRIGDQ